MRNPKNRICKTKCETCGDQTTICVPGTVRQQERCVPVDSQNPFAKICAR
jgi:hypothetical protein